MKGINGACSGEKKTGIEDVKEKRSDLKLSNFIKSEIVEKEDKTI